MNEIISIFYFLSFLSILCKASEVETTHGRVTGKTFKTLYEGREYHGFMGIPFAAPPVKELRFKVPLAVVII